MSDVYRQSTAADILVGPVLDADGVAVTTLTISDFKLSKNGAAPAALNGSATATHRHTGHYSIGATTSDTDTVGCADITVDSGTNAMAPKSIQVIEEAVYDALYAASATGPLTTLGTNAPAGWINEAAFANNAITDAKVASDVTIASVTNAVTVGTNNDKTGYKLASDGLDSISTTAPSGVAANFREMMVQVWRRFFKRATLTSSELVTYADDDTTPVTTQPVSDNGTTQVQGPAS